MGLILTRYLRSSKNAPNMKNSGAMLYWKLTEHLIVEKIHNPKNIRVEKSEKTGSMNSGSVWKNTAECSRKNTQDASRLIKDP